MKSSSSDEYYIVLLNNCVLYMYKYGNTIIYIVGAVGNLVSIGIFLKKTWRKNVCVFYFLISLLLSLVYLHSTILSTSFANGWAINVLHLNTCICKLMFYVTFVTSALTPTILIFASIDRLLISSNNVHVRLYSSKRLAYLLTSISTIFWMIFNIHILIKVDIQQLDVSVVVCYYDSSSVYRDFVDYFLTIFNCLIILLMIILSIFALRNVRRIRACPRQHRREIRSMKKRDFQLLHCLFTHDLVYIFVSVMSSFFNVYRTSTRDRERTMLEQTIVYFLENLFAFIYFTFHCTSFFIFICVSKTFRQEVKRLIHKMYGEDMVILQEQQQTNSRRNNIELKINAISVQNEM